MPRFLTALFPWLFCLVLLIPVSGQAADSVETAGDALAVLLGASALGSGWYHQDLPGAKQYAASALVSSGATVLLKYTIDEQRPNGDDHSFPSLHSSFAFSSAEFLRRRYGLRYGLPAYAAAGFVGYSRVESDNHYWHDVLAGAAIGIASSYFLSEPWPGLQMSTAATADFVGLRLSSRW